MYIFLALLSPGARAKKQKEGLYLEWNVSTEQKKKMSEDVRVEKKNFFFGSVEKKRCHA